METTIATAIVIGLTQVFKQFDFNPRLTPVFALLAGIGIMVVSNYGSVGETVVTGLVIGLSAIGLYGVTTNSIIGSSLSKRFGISKNNKKPKDPETLIVG